MSWLPFVEVHVTWDEFAKLADAATGDHADGVDLRLVARTTVRQRFSFKEEWK